MASYGFARTRIYKWLPKVKGRGNGLKRLKSTKGTGRPRTLTPAQERQVFWWINGRDPGQHGFDFGLWTRQIVRELLGREFGVALGLTGAGRLVAKPGVTPQKALHRAHQRDPEANEQWEHEENPGLS